MLKWIATKLIKNAEAKTGEPGTFMEDVLEADMAAFWKFGMFTPMSTHRKTVPSEAWHLARLGAMQVQDCGPCVQTTINYAVADRVAPHLLQAGLDGGHDLAGDHLLAYRFGKAVAENSYELTDLLEEVEATFGKAGQVELALCIAGAAVYPTVKRALGHGLSCAKVVLDVEGTIGKAA